MLREFVQAIAEMATNAHKPQIVAAPGDPRHCRVFVNGTSETLDIPRPDQASTVATVDDLVAAVERYGGENSAIWHNQSCICAVLDDSDRRELIRLDLKLSDQMRAICALPEPFDPKSLIVWLKKKMVGAVNDELANVFRSLDFQRTDQASSRVKHESESLGRSVQATVTPTIPEVLKPNVRIYANPDLPMRRVIRLSLDVDHAHGQLELDPLADEVELAVQSVQAEIHELLCEAVRGPELPDIPVIHGMPVFQPAPKLTA